MAYVEEFRSRLGQRDFPRVLALWQEYCQGDMVDGEEIVEILKLFKESDFVSNLGSSIEAVLPLALQIPEELVRLNALALILDIQTTNSAILADVVFQIVKNFSQDPLFNEKLRLVGLRGAQNFQGALSNFFLLNHINKNSIVLHTAGWGVGEILDFSFLREQITIEFENLNGVKREISFKNAFKTLIPLSKEHFLARRFVDPDALEKEARENPVAVVRMLLQDTGSKTATEIKDLMAAYVIPESGYAKWWQQARAKLKKDPLIEVPENMKEPFYIRKGSVSWEERLDKTFARKKSFKDVLVAAYALVRDFPEVLKDKKSAQDIVAKIMHYVDTHTLLPSESIAAHLFLEQIGHQKDVHIIQKMVQEIKNVDECLAQIEIAALKRSLLQLIRTSRSDWKELFFHLLFVIEPNQLKDFVFKELTGSETQEVLKAKIEHLLKRPKKYPEAVVWYFQKIVANEAPFYSDAEGKCHFFEAFLILFSSLGTSVEYKDLLRKMYTMITGNRFQLVRDLLKNTSIHFAKELLLLASKCHTFSDHDQKIFKSLVEVVHPSLTTEKESRYDHHVIWTTAQGYQKTQERIKHLGTVEVVDNAREIETARAHGDLRENAEYKSAIERRSRLQNELKALSDQFHKARIITKDDIASDSVGVGSIVEISTPQGEQTTYTILGPWEADPDKYILSFQSKLAQAMMGKRMGEHFPFKDEEFTVLSIRSYL